MAFGLFKKNKPGGGAADGAGKGGGAVAAPGGDGENTGGFKRDERKARRWFEHAAGVADHDFAIECYIHGLEHDPDNMGQHEALREVALKRKVSGGKPASFADRVFKGAGKDPIKRLLHAEKIWAKDPLDVDLMTTVMERAIEADAAEANLKLGELAYWVGDLILQANQVSKPLPKATLIKVRDLFARIPVFDKAVEACRMALSLDMNDPLLLSELKNLEAERTIQASGYNNAGKSDFRGMIKDSDKQRELELADATVKTESMADQLITRRRAELEEMPEDLDRMQKLVDALLQKETDPADEEAIQLLKEAWERTSQYRFKERIGNIKMRQFSRQLRALKPVAAKAAENSEDRKVFHELAQKRLAFELEEYAERVQNYPTDMGFRFELGRRLFQAKKLDEAIGMLQQSKADPKYRAASHELLGQCFLTQGWLDEAIQTLQAGLESNPDEKRELEMQYLKMGALEQSAVKTRNLDHAREAQKLASQIMQANINFRDIRTQMGRLQKLVEEIEKEKKSP